MQTKIQLDDNNKALFQARRTYYEARPSVLKETLSAGNTRTIMESQETGLVREAMHLSYHDLLGGTHFVAG